jgi:hypothetical protein
MYKDIITDVMFPFVADKFNYSVNLHQDNDRKHSSKICTNALNNLGINWVSGLFQYIMKLNLA